MIVPRRRRPGDPPNPLAAEHVADDPEGLDVLFAASRHSVAPLLRAYEPDRFVDVSRRTEEVHRQVRAWSFVPPFVRDGPVLERDGRRVRVVRSSLSEVDGAERLDCADGPLWIVATEPA